MKPGDLIKIPVNRRMFGSTYLFWVFVKKDSYLLCIEEMDLKITKSAARAASNFTRSYDAIEKELNRTGKIKGYKFLHPDGKYYVWVSHYDVEALERY